MQSGDSVLASPGSRRWATPWLRPMKGGLLSLLAAVWLAPLGSSAQELDVPKSMVHLARHSREILRLRLGKPNEKGEIAATIETSLKARRSKPAVVLLADSNHALIALRQERSHCLRYLQFT